MKHTFCLLLLICVLSACKNDDDQVPSRTVFEIKTDDDNFQSDIWVLLHDNETGEFIDSKQIFGNATTTFESTKKIPGSRLTVTIFRASGGAGQSNYATVYSAIDLGSKWRFDYAGEGGTPRITTGYYFLTVNNVPSFRSVNVSDELGIASYSWNHDNVTVTTLASISSVSNKQLISIYPETGDPKYLEVEDLVVDQPVTVDYSDFKDFDKYVTVTYPVSFNVLNFYVTGGYDDANHFFDAYWLGSYDNNGGLSSQTETSVGFLNSIDNYYVVIQAAYWRYLSQGAAPTSIDFPSGDGYSVAGTTIDDYEMTATKGHKYTLSYFYGADVNVGSLAIEWFASEEIKKTFYPLTTELEEKYHFEKSWLKYNGNDFFVGGRSYSEMIRANFEETYDKTTSFFESRIFVTPN